jgi:hypothetical protein
MIAIETRVESDSFEVIKFSASVKSMAKGV